MKALKHTILCIVFQSVMIFPPNPAEGQIIQLRVLGWGDLPAYETSFEKYASKKGITVDLVHVEPFLLEETDVFDGLRSEKAEVIIIPNKMLLQDQAQLKELLLPISTEELQNYNRIDATIRNNPLFQKLDEINGVRYGVPYRADIQTILFNATKLKEAPQSWQALWSSTHSGKVSPFGYQTEWNVGVTLLAMGYTPKTAYNMEAQEIDWKKVLTKLGKLAQNSYASWEWPPSDKLIEECDMLYGFGLLLRFSNLRDANWQVAMPQEGVQLWVDDFCISASLELYPEKLKTAYLFIDFMLSDAMQMKVYEDQYYIPVTSPALTQLSSAVTDVRINETFYKTNSHMLMQPMNMRTRNFYKLLWDKALESPKKSQP